MRMGGGERACRGCGNGDRNLRTGGAKKFSDARTGLKVAMNAIMLQTYWHTGEYIVEYEQHGADRAVYGDGLMRRLARDLTLRLGRGFAHSNLNYMRKFYLVSQKIQTSGFLTWSHYLEILRADAVEGCTNGDATERRND